MDIEPQLSEALKYVRLGYRVLPVHGIRPDGACTCQGEMPECTRGSPGKHPRIMAWGDNATGDSGQVREWWGRWSGSNVGILTGTETVVADFDGPTGVDLAQHRKVTSDDAVPLAQTGRGLHAFYRAPNWPARTTATLPGLDFRGLRAFVVAPPSRHFSGAAYRWVRELRPVEDLPGPPHWLSVVPDRATRRKAAVPRLPAGKATMALGYACTAISEAKPGRRNRVLYDRAWYLAGLVEARRLDLMAFWTRLTDAGIRAGLEPAEIEGTLASALRRRGVASIDAIGSLSAMRRETAAFLDQTSSYLSN